MKRLKFILIFGILAVAASAAFFIVPDIVKKYQPAENSILNNSLLPTSVATSSSLTPLANVQDNKIKFIGPRQNLPKEAPADYGFWSLAIPVPGVLSRSGQPTLQDFKWLKEHSWKSVVDLRVDGERGEIGDDTKISGFIDLHFNYLALPIVDGAAPTNEQAQKFLEFVTNPDSQPVHVHCRGGIGRTGVMVALYRYSVQGWSIQDAINESKLFQGGISSSQKNWLEQWAQNHVPGIFGK